MNEFKIRQQRDKDVRAALMHLRRIFTAGRWVRGTMQVTRKDGVVSFCLVGGLRHVTDYTRHPDLYRETRLAVKKAVPGRMIIEFNDSRNDVSEVIEVLDEAVAIIDKKGTR